MLWAFVPIAVLVTITPGAATAMIVRNSLRGGGRAGAMTIVGNSIGVIAWALLSVLGVSALVAASEAAFVALKVTGAAVLVWLGIGSLRRARAGVPLEEPARDASKDARRALRDGLVTSLANPKLAVFFVALFPQFVEARADVLPAALLMACLIVTFDVLWYGTLAFAVSRAKRAFVRSRVARAIEGVTGAVLVALGARVALEQR
jgi:RhtB (resistance to homoserine/threonine) family protein